MNLLIYLRSIAYYFYFLYIPDVSRKMSLPLNGFHQDSEMDQLSSSPEQTDRLEGTVEDWPDWSDPDSENRDGHSVQIHIQASKGVDPVSSLAITHQNTDEEPWDDFEDTEPTSDLSPTAPLSDSVIPAPPKGGAASPSSKHGPEPLRLGSSKPLKLSSTLRQSTKTEATSLWDNSWAQEKRNSQKSHNRLNPQSKPTVPQKSSSVGLGEEFTIRVKTKVQQDPELDLFADMVPDIKLSSPAVLSLQETGKREAELSTASSDNTKPLQVDSSIDTLTFTAKFAAVDLTEVSVW